MTCLPSLVTECQVKARLARGISPVSHGYVGATFKAHGDDSRVALCFFVVGGVETAHLDVFLQTDRKLDGDAATDW